MTKFSICLTNHHRTWYWLLPDGIRGQGFTIDIGGTKAISEFYLRNTHNTIFNDRFVSLSVQCSTISVIPCNPTLMFDRGTREFCIETSTDRKNWSPAVKDTLFDARNLGCDIPIQTFSFQWRNVRFIRFTAMSFYGRSAGLEYISWNGIVQVGF